MLTSSKAKPAGSDVRHVMESRIVGQEYAAVLQQREVRCAERERVQLRPHGLPSRDGGFPRFLLRRNPLVAFIPETDWGYRPPGSPAVGGSPQIDALRSVPVVGRRDHRPGGQC